MPQKTADLRGHTAVRVSDIDRSIAFYQETVGLEKLREITLPDGTRVAFFPGIELHQAAGKCSPDQIEQAAFFHHIGLEVKDIGSYVQELTSSGVKFTLPLTEIELADRGVVVKFAFFKDPDGIPVEVAEWSKLGG